MPVSLWNGIEYVPIESSGDDSDEEKAKAASSGSEKAKAAGPVVSSFAVFGEAKPKANKAASGKGKWIASGHDSYAVYTGAAVLVQGAAPDGKGLGAIQIYPGMLGWQRADLVQKANQHFQIISDVDTISYTIDIVQIHRCVLVHVVEVVLVHVKVVCESDMCK